MSFPFFYMGKPLDVSRAIMAPRRYKKRGVGRGVAEFNFVDCDH